MKINNFLSLKKVESLKILFLMIVYLLVFYFFVFRNLLNYFELEDLIETENIKIQRLTYQKKEIEQAVVIKRGNLDKIMEELLKSEEMGENKKYFKNYAELLKFLNLKMEENNIYLESFGRNRKEGNILKLSVNIKAEENNVKNFLKAIENSEYSFSLTESYFKIFLEKNLLNLNINIKTKIDEKEIIANKIQENKNLNNKDIFKKEYSKNSEKASYIRIGQRKFLGRMKIENEEKIKNKEMEAREK